MTYWRILAKYAEISRRIGRDANDMKRLLAWHRQAPEPTAF